MSEPNGCREWTIAILLAVFALAALAAYATFFMKT